MPDMNGMQLMSSARHADPSLPFVLMTGQPSVDTAIRAVEARALRYLVKPMGATVLLECASEAVRLRREHSSSVTRQRSARFARALDRLWMAYQPIVSCAWGKTRGYEALVRTDEAELANPAALLGAAESLNRLRDLGRSIREQVARAAPAIDGELFINLHPQDLLDPDLYDPRSPLTRVASRVILELTERAALDTVDDIEARIEQLRQVGFRIAIDDLGEGYAALTSFARLSPEFVKLDMALIRGLHESSFKRRVVGALIKLCDDLGVAVISEGVETAEERDALVALGCDLLQGYLFGRPSRQLPGR
jgi:EAL domain-containing protein (putative c-di-GMP-specific phosphodiesterase class I)